MADERPKVTSDEIATGIIKGVGRLILIGLAIVAAIAAIVWGGLIVHSLITGRAIGEGPNAFVEQKEACEDSGGMMIYPKPGNTAVMLPRCLPSGQSMPDGWYDGAPLPKVGSDNDYDDLNDNGSWDVGEPQF